LGPSEWRDSLAGREMIRKKDDTFDNKMTIMDDEEQKKVSH